MRTLPKKIGSERSGARHQTGTLVFMAIQVLQGVAHTYRHDFESFFYVLVWICARRVWERGFQCRSADRPSRSVLTKWYSGSFQDIADAKRGYMHVDGFKRVLIEFPPAFDCIKPVCENLRGILFPYNNGLLIGTPSDPPEELYRPIIDAFDSGYIRNCRWLRLRTGNVLFLVLCIKSWRATGIVMAVFFGCKQHRVYFICERRKFMRRFKRNHLFNRT